MVEIDRLRQALEEAQSSNKAAATTSQLVTSALSNKITDAAQLQLHLKTLEAQLEEAQDEITHKQRLTLQQVGGCVWRGGEAGRLVCAKTTAVMMARTPT
jgi:hypothetical protein